MAKLQLNFLGSVTIYNGDTLLTELLKARKAVALLAYLAIVEGPHERSKLSALLWSELSDENARTNLRRVVSTLRKSVGSHLIISNNTLAFDQTISCELDIAQLQAASKKAAPTLEELKSSADCYKGEFLEGLTIRNEPLFQDWVDRQVEVCRDYALDTLRETVQQAIDAQHFDSAIRYARRRLTIEPWLEEGHRQLMLALALSGQRSEALKQFTRCEEMLSAEFGIQPTADTRTLYRQIATNALPSAQSYPRLPTPPSHTNDEAAAITPPISKNRQQQLLLLEKVRSFWVESVFESTFRNASHVPLVKNVCLEQVAKAQMPNPSAGSGQIIEKSIVEVFYAFNQALLILGEPGSGKTMTLIKLANELLLLAEQDASQPIPVLLNLSSWGNQPIEQWIVTELTVKYQIPQRLGRAWLDSNSLTLLLDGLDEVSMQRRTACIHAINHFRQTHGITGVAVCSRSGAYTVAGAPLHLSGCLTLQSFSAEQVQTYLQKSGLPADTASLIQTEIAKHAVAKTPLMLNIISRSYRQSETLTLPVATQARDFQTQVFSAYVKRMLGSRGQHVYDALLQKRVVWLARKMQHFNQTIYLIEQMQPSWLSGKNWQRTYILLSRLFDGALVGLVMWLTWFCSQWISGPETRQIFNAVSNTFGIPTLLSKLLIWIALSASFGFLLALFHMALFDRRSRMQGTYSTGRPDWPLLAGTGGIVFASSFLFMLLIGSWTSALLDSFGQAIGFMLLTYFGHGSTYNDDIRVVERIGWSWKMALRTAPFGLLWSLGICVILTQFQGSILSVAAQATLGLFFGAGFFLLGGLRASYVEKSSAPNQGIRLAARNGLFAGGVTAIIFAVVGSLASFPLVGHFEGLFVVLAVAFSSIGTAFLYGGINVTSHFLLRLLLWLQGTMPLNIADVLEQAVDHVFMRRVGSGYIFVHRLLREHFASAVFSAETVQKYPHVELHHPARHARRLAGDPRHLS